MRWIFALIIPALLVFPTFGQAAGESATAAKAIKVKSIKIIFPTSITKEKTKTIKKKVTTKKKDSNNTANSTKSDTSKKTNTSTSNSSQPTSVKSTSESVSSTPSTTDSDILAVEREVVRLVNVEREKQGLKPLELDSKLSSIARKKSQDMKDKNYFSHQSPTYGSPFDMLKQFGVSYQTAGENIAAGQRSAQEVVDGWMNSKGHRENILNSSFTRIGVGYVSGGSYGSYWTQLFTG
jgi:uncharacterized YkwD family protein